MLSYLRILSCSLESPLSHPSECIRLPQNTVLKLIMGQEGRGLFLETWDDRMVQWLMTKAERSLGLDFWFLGFIPKGYSGDPSLCQKKIILNFFLHWTEHQLSAATLGLWAKLSSLWSHGCLVLGLHSESLSKVPSSVRVPSSPSWIFEPRFSLANSDTLSKFNPLALEIRELPEPVNARIYIYTDLGKGFPTKIGLECENRSWKQVLDYEHNAFQCRLCS